MKKSLNISFIFVLGIVLGACSSTYKAGIAEYDDLYYTPRDAKMQSRADQSVVTAVPNEQAATAELSDYEKYRLTLEQGGTDEQVQEAGSEYLMEDSSYYGPQEYAYYDDGSQPPAVNNYYGTVNQYPSYATRFERFHSPYIGYRYYDPWYYSSWYDPFYYDPWYYDPWYSSWGPGFGVNIGFGFGWGYGGWGYPYYGYPGWGYGSYYSSYGMGYNRGWYDGYYGGGYYYPTPYYYYSDAGRGSGYTYGHRESRSGYSTYGARTTEDRKTSVSSGNYERTRAPTSGNPAVTATRANTGSADEIAGRRSTAITAAGTSTDNSRSRMQGTQGNAYSRTDEKTPATSRASYTGDAQRNSNANPNTRTVTSLRGTDQKPGNGQGRTNVTGPEGVKSDPRYTTRSNNTSRYTTTTRNSYAPTYTKPRTAYRPTYNTGSSRSSSTYKSTAPRTTYTQPGNTSTYRSVSPSRSSSGNYRSTPSSTYRSTPSSSYRSSGSSGSSYRSSGSSYRSSSGSSGSVSRSSGSVSRSSGSVSRSSSSSSSSGGGRRR
jgi:hypothetical protein